jgi:hypothetical protein
VTGTDDPTELEVGPASPPTHSNRAFWSTVTTLDRQQTSIANVRISCGSIVVLAKDQVSCDLNGEAAILNLNDGICHGLNEWGPNLEPPERTDHSQPNSRST